MVQPRMGHIDQALHVISYLKVHDRSWIVINSNKFDIDWTPFSNEESPQQRALIMSKLYPESKDEDPPNMPPPRGEKMQLLSFLDADHAGNKVTRRSQTGIIVYANMTPIVWLSKRQNTIESSTFGSEFIALKAASEMIDGLRYKLKMLGVPLEGAARVLCDNESVIKNGTFSESVLRKKYCSIAYHLVREHVSSQKILIYYERSNSNLADLFTKVLNYDTRMRLIPAILS